MKMKNPFLYKCTDSTLKLYKVYGPGIPVKGNNITICDEQSARESVQEYFKVYMAGWKDGHGEMTSRF
jgi:hypothetical protein